MDAKIEVVVEVDITEEANNRGMSVQKFLKQLYEECNIAVGLFGKESKNLDYYILNGILKDKKFAPKISFVPKKPLEMKIGLAR